MVVVAGVIDGVQFLINFIPVMGWFASFCISISAWLIFFIWFKFNNVGFLEGKYAVFKIVSLFGVSTIEYTPIFNDLPAWIAFTIIMFLLVRVEDKLYNITENSKKALEYY